MPVQSSPAHLALDASRELVARRKGVPMVVSLRDARGSGGGAAAGGDEGLAGLFEAYREQLHPDGADDEAAVIETLQAVAYASLKGGAQGPGAAGRSGGRHRAVADDLRAGRFLRVMNYHNTPPSMRGELVTELGELAERYDTVTLDDLDRLTRTGAWHKERQPLLPVFYEGYRDNYEVAAAACEEAGVVGWFFVCTGWLDTPVPEQYDFALAHRIKLVAENPRDERIAMTWDEIADLHRRGHVVTPHTASHELAERVVTPQDVRREVTDPKRLMDAATGGDAACTAWLAGTSYTGGTGPDRALTDAGYRYLFANTMVQRI
ncbi:polysaccharide deacetylase family protein [Streptomyces sp. NPDC048182]|uniref:polysaccharide deacetylase family protein n=1 Tax=unclassified Streptomyces TaxID=2593676 RepID=UPI0033B7D261